MTLKEVINHLTWMAGQVKGKTHEEFLLRAVSELDSVQKLRDELAICRIKLTDSKLEAAKQRIEIEELKKAWEKAEVKKKLEAKKRK